MLIWYICVVGASGSTESPSFQVQISTVYFRVLREGPGRIIADYARSVNLALTLGVGAIVAGNWSRLNSLFYRQFGSNLHVIR